MIDLSKFYTESLSSTDYDYESAGKYLTSLTSGVHKWSEIEFDVRGVVQLNGEELRKTGAHFPSRVGDIPIGQRCQRIYFVHSAGWSEKDGAKIGHYTIHYKDGQIREIPIVYGDDVADYFWGPEQLRKASLVWKTRNPLLQEFFIKLYMSVWDNPLPEVEVQSIDFESAMTTCSPFLIAITIK